jgi:uncharacterized protein YhaN
MRIDRLKLIKFGGRSGLSLDGLKPGANIIYGANEAGKTTLMEAVRAVLFGYVDKRSKRNRFALTTGDQRHLQLDLTLKNGSRWQLDRTEGKDGLVIRDLVGGIEVPESLLRNALLHAERTLYEGIFAFSLNDLTNHDALDDNEIHDRLLGAALGAGAVSPAKALTFLESRRDSYYKKSSKTKFNEARKRLKTARSQITSLKSLPREYDELVQRIAASKTQRDALRVERAALSQQVSRGTLLVGSQDEWRQLDATRLMAGGLNHAAHMPVDAEAKIDNAANERDRSAQLVRGRQQDVQSLAIQLEGLVIPQGLEPFFPELERFTAETSNRNNLPKAIQSERSAVERAEQTAERNRRACGGDWDDEKASMVAEVRPLQTEARRLHGALKAAADGRTAANGKLADADAHIAQLKQKSAQAKQELEGLAELSALPNDAGERISRFAGEIESSKIREQAFRNEAAGQRKLAEAIEVDATAADQLVAIESAQNLFQARSDTPEVLGRLHSAAENSVDALRVALEKCGPDIDPQQIQRWGTNAELEADVATSREALGRAERSLHEAQERLDSCNKAKGEGEAALAGYIDADWWRAGADKRGHALQQEIDRQEEGLEAMGRLLESLRLARTRRDEAAERHEQRKRDATQSLAGLPDLPQGKKWSEAELKAVHKSPSILTQVQDWAQKLGALDVDVKATHKALADRHQRAEATEQKVTQLEETLSERHGASTADPGQAEHLRSWLEADREFERVRERATDLQSSIADQAADSAKAKAPAGSSLGMIGGVLLVGLVVAGVLAVLDLSPAALVAALAGVGVAGLLALLRSNAQRSRTADMARAEERLAKMRDTLKGHQERVEAQQATLARCGDNLREFSPLERQAVEVALRRIQADAGAFLKLQADSARLESLREQLADFQKALSIVEADAARASSLHTEASEGWKHFVTDIEIPADASAGQNPAQLWPLLMDLQAAQSIADEAELAFGTRQQTAARVEALEAEVAAHLQTHDRSVSTHSNGQGDTKNENVFDEEHTRWRKNLRRLEHAQQSLASLQGLERALADAEAQEEQRRRTKDDEENAWMKLCEGYGLPGNLPPRELQRRLPLFRTAASAMTQCERADKALEVEEQRWQALCGQLSADTGIEIRATFDTAKVITLLDNERQRLKAWVERISERDGHLREEKNSLAQADKEQRASVTKARSRDDLLSEWGMESVAAFNASRSKVERYEKLKRSLQETQDDLTAVTGSRQPLAQQALAAVEDERTTNEAFQRFLSRNHLPVDLDLEAVDGLLSAIGDYKCSLEALEIAQKSQAGILDRWRKMLGDYQPLLSAMGLSSKLETAEPTDVVSRIAKAVNKLRDAGELQKEIAQKERELAEAKLHLNQLEVNFQGRVDTIDTLIGDSHASSEDQFRIWDGDAKRLREFEYTRDKLVASLRAKLQSSLGLPEGDSDALLQQLRETDWDEEDRALTEAQEKLQTVTDALNTLGESIGGDEILRAQHEQSDELARHRQEEAAAQAELEAAAEEWLHWSTAVALLEKARSRFEKERQPKVLQRASAYLAQLTDNAFSNIHVRLGENEMQAVRSDGTLVPLLHMSRGSVEPFYLALRLALIDDYADDETGAPPVLMDDILVNFDDTRSQFAAQAVQQLAQKTQVLLLTCHERTVANFETLGSGVNIVRLGA